MMVPFPESLESTNATSWPVSTSIGQTNQTFVPGSGWISKLDSMLEVKVPCYAYEDPRHRAPALKLIAVDTMPTLPCI